MKASSFQRIDIPLSRDVETKYDVIKTVFDDLDNINAVNADLSNINLVAPHVGNIDINATNIADINTTALNMPDVNTVAGSIISVNTVNTNIVDINTCATNIGDISIAASNVLDINTVAGSMANVNTVAGSISNVNSVAGDLTNIDTVAININNVNTVATDIANINNVNADLINIDNVSNDLSSINTVSPHVANIDTVATSIANVNTVAPDIAKVVNVSNDLDNIDAVNANKTNIDTVANDKANIDITANSIDNVNTYAKTYYGPLLSTNPTTRPDGTAIQTGDMYFDSTLNQMKVYDGTLWKAAGSTVNGTSQRQTFTATAGQTTFTIAGGYDATFADVYMNGRKLINGDEIDVSSGTDVVLSVGAIAGDIVDVVAYGAFLVANTYTKAEIDTGYATKTLSTTADLDVLNKVKNVDGPGSGLDADTVDGVQGALLGIGGAGYSWVDETANRVAGTTYTNTTGKPIIVRVAAATSTTAVSVVRLLVDGGNLGNIGTRGSTTSDLYVINQILVPDGSTYSAELTGSAAFIAWFELK